MAMRGSRTEDSPTSYAQPAPDGRGTRRRRFRWRRPRGAPLPPGVRGRAILDGERAAWARQYDEWSFSPETRIAYLEFLENDGERAVAAGHARAAEKAESARLALRKRLRNAAVAAVTAQSRVENTSRRRDRARDREQVSLDTLDLIAGTSFSRLPGTWYDPDEDQRVGVTADQEPRDPPGRRETNDPQGSADEEHGAAEESDERSAVTEEVADAAAGDQRDGRDRPRWVGPANGRFSEFVPGWLRLVTLLLLAAVETPIYYKIFSYFNGGDPRLTLAFTIPIALGMVLAPHLAGKLHRRRQDVPREPLIPFLTAFVVALWFTAGCLLGWLRQKVLLVPRIDPLTGKSIGLASELHVSWWTMTGVFASVLLLSGLIAFMLGLGEAHPVVAGYHAAVRATDEAEAEYEVAVRAHAEAAEPVRMSEDEIRADSAAEAERVAQAVRSEYQAAAEAYLDAVAREIGDPNITEATSAVRRDRLPGGPGPWLAG